MFDVKNRNERKNMILEGGRNINMEAAGINKPRKKRLKRLIAWVIFWFLGRGTEAAARLDSMVAREVDSLEEGFVIMLKVEPAGPSMILTKSGGRLRFMGIREAYADLTIYFKNIEAALLVLSGRVGIAGAFAEHRFMMKGDIALGMTLVRILSMVEAYLFPGFMTRRILKRMPQKRRSSLRIYIGALLGI